MGQPLLSIIIPVYNVEQYLVQCVNSVVSDKHVSDTEIVIVNDGSTDQSLELCRQLKSIHSNIKLICQTNQGLSEARNTGIRAANGKYILFLDSDDFLKSEALDKIVDRLKYKDVDMLLGRAYNYYEDTGRLCISQIDYSVIKSISPSDVFAELNALKSFWFAAWLVIINREFLIQ